MDPHPYREAWRTRDVGVWTDVFAPDVVVYSPILSAPFRGRAAALELFEVLLEGLGELEITHESSAEHQTAFFWRVRVGARWIEGVDLLRTNAQGKIDEIRVMIRPLPDIAHFAGAVGPAMAARRSPVRAPIVRALLLPLRVLLAFADRVSARLVQS